VSDIDEGTTAVRQVILCTVMAKIRRDVYVCRHRCGGEEGVPRSAADGHRANLDTEVTGDTHPVRRRRKCAGHH
jgi:hypothetical protein